MPNPVDKKYRFTAAPAVLLEQKRDVARSGVISTDEPQFGGIIDARFLKYKMQRGWILDAGPSVAVFCMPANTKINTFFEVGFSYWERKIDLLIGANIGVGAAVTFDKRHLGFVMPAGTLSVEAGVGGVGLEVGAMGIFDGILKVKQADPFVAFVFEIGRYIGWSG